MVEKERKISQMSDESLCENYAGNKMINFTFLILMTDDLKRKKNKIKERQKKGSQCVLKGKGKKYAAKEKPNCSFQPVLLSHLLKILCSCLKHSRETKIILSKVAGTHISKNSHPIPKKKKKI